MSWLRHRFFTETYRSGLTRWGILFQATSGWELDAWKITVSAGRNRYVLHRTERTPQ